MDATGGLPGLPPAPGAPAAVREESVANAVAFLQHPKARLKAADAACGVAGARARAHARPQVRPSAVEYKRAFLEKKGLTAAEISEAFRRVPEPPPGSAPAPADYAPPQQPVAPYAPPPPPPPPGLSWPQARPFPSP